MADIGSVLRKVSFLVQNIRLSKGALGDPVQFRHGTSKTHKDDCPCARGFLVCNFSEEAEHHKSHAPTQTGFGKRSVDFREGISGLGRLNTLSARETLAVQKTNVLA